MCHKQPSPNVTHGPRNNSLATAFWQDAAAHSKRAGWWDRVFDYTCDEPGADPARYPVCEAHARAVHGADEGYRVMITAEKASADRASSPGGHG